MSTRKIIQLSEARYTLKEEFTPAKCNACRLDIHEKLETCFRGCFDEIIQSENDLKNKIGIFNALASQEHMKMTACRIATILQ